MNLDSYVLRFWLTLMLYSLVDDLASNSDEQFCPILQLSNVSQILMDSLDLNSEDQYSPYNLLHHLPTLLVHIPGRSADRFVGVVR